MPGACRQDRHILFKHVQNTIRLRPRRGEPMRCITLAQQTFWVLLKKGGKNEVAYI